MPRRLLQRLTCYDSCRGDRRSGSAPCGAGGLFGTSGTRSRAGRRRRSPRTNWVGVDLRQHTRDDCLPPAPGGKPREHRSGTSVHKRTRLSKAGNARLRKALHLPALTAIRFNPPLGGCFYARLVKAGKAKRAALGACMRKLLIIADGVLKSRTPFDPARGSKITA
ncbi:MAG: transposase [Planctomycetia bacterium]